MNKLLINKLIRFARLVKEALDYMILMIPTCFRALTWVSISLTSRTTSAIHCQVVQNWVPHLKYHDHILVFLLLFSMSDLEDHCHQHQLHRRKHHEGDHYTILTMTSFAERALICPLAKCCVLLSANSFTVCLPYLCGMDDSARKRSLTSKHGSKMPFSCNFNTKKAHCNEQLTCISWSFVSVWQKSNLKSESRLGRLTSLR